MLRQQSDLRGGSDPPEDGSNRTVIGQTSIKLGNIASAANGKRRFTKPF
jgi:hypothetical protein